MQQQEKLQYRIAILNEIIRYLGEFLSTVAEPNRKTIHTDLGLPVPEEDIKEVIQLIQDTLLVPKRLELENLMNIDIVEKVINAIREDPNILPYVPLHWKGKGY
uniref:Uncharacterized protein n=1 Tax=Dictyoglomus turgidum TaxID=513050 RepID=A0A7C3WVJ6_9BACT